MKMMVKPTKKQAEQAIKTLLEYIGEDSNREGLIETPKRVISSYSEFFKGYNQNLENILSKTFKEYGDYDGIILLKNIKLESHCEHHMLPIIGKAHVAYLPNNSVVGISKIARAVNVFAKRLQTQERLTMQIALSIEKIVKPKGVAVIIDAEHYCMTIRGVNKPESSTITSCMRGIFDTDKKVRSDFMSLVKKI